jgi:putative transcriptional regulator
MANIFKDLMSGLDEVDAFLAGQTAGYKVTLPAEVDVKNIRKRLKMTQARFSSTFGFSLDAVKHWEGGRRKPESSARAFLTVIAKNPTQFQVRKCACAKTAPCPILATFFCRKGGIPRKHVFSSAPEKPSRRISSR